MPWGEKGGEEEMEVLPAVTSLGRMHQKRSENSQLIMDMPKWSYLLE